jgi:hypothetical protein
MANKVLQADTGGRPRDLPASDRSGGRNTSIIDSHAAPKNDRYKIVMWKFLLSGLFILGALAIAGAVVLILNGKESSPAWILATAVVTGSIGLFSAGPSDPEPAQK